MMRIALLVVVSALVPVLQPAASGQAQWTYRARIIAEAGKVSVADTDRSTYLLVTAADGAWENGRWRFAGGFVGADARDAKATLVAREAYGRVSATSWMDLEAGKRLLRWGVGYGFAPTGVLDPPRSVTDPTDRFGRQEGLPLARADLFAGSASVSVAAARKGDRNLGALRVKTLLANGFDVSVIAVAEESRKPAFGGNVTHVVGDRLEWHAEMLVHDRAEGPNRMVSSAAGLQYTLSGVNVVMEYHRRESGHALFGRAARASADARLIPEVIIMRSLDRDEWVSMAGAGWRARPGLEFHARVSRTSRVRSFTAGATARF